MRTREKVAADLASAAARRLDTEAEVELSKQAKAAKTKARDQLLEAAYNLVTGNVPIQTANGWIIKSKSTVAGTVARIKIGDITLQKQGALYIVNDEYISPSPFPGKIECDIEVGSGKTYMVSLDADRCTCAGGSVPGNTCWHMCAVEFYLEAGKHGYGRNRFDKERGALLRIRRSRPNAGRPDGPARASCNHWRVLQGESPKSFPHG